MVFRHPQHGIAAAIPVTRMVPVSTGKQFAAILGAVALGYTLSWLSTPSPIPGPVDNFDRNFVPSAAPLIVAPDPSHDDRSADPSGSTGSSPKALERQPFEPI